MAPKFIQENLPPSVTEISGWKIWQRVSIIRGWIQDLKYDRKPMTTSCEGGGHLKRKHTFTRMLIKNAQSTATLHERNESLVYVLLTFSVSLIFIFIFIFLFNCRKGVVRSHLSKTFGRLMESWSIKLMCTAPAWLRVTFCPVDLPVAPQITVEHHTYIMLAI